MNNPSIFVAPPTLKLPTAPLGPLPSSESADLLRQLLDVQKEQLALSKNAAAAADSQTRWKNFLARWQTEFPDIGIACKEVLPIIERTYLRMIAELTARLRGDEPDDLESEFVLAEFLDKYGLRLSQLGTIVSQLSPIADATPSPAVEPEPS